MNNRQFSSSLHGLVVPRRENWVKNQESIICAGARKPTMELLEHCCSSMPWTRVLSPLALCRDSADVCAFLSAKKQLRWGGWRPSLLSKGWRWGCLWLKKSKQCLADLVLAAVGDTCSSQEKGHRRLYSTKVYFQKKKMLEQERSLRRCEVHSQGWWKEATDV